MANDQIKFGIGFNVDTASLNQVKTALQEIQKMTGVDFFKLNTGGTVNDLMAAQKAAKELEQALQKAFNKDLGTLNVTKFNNSLKQSGRTLNDIYTDITKVGTVGQSAFRNVATQILTTNKQLKQTHSLLDSMAETMGNTIKWGIASSVMNNFSGSVQKAYGYVKALDTSLNDIRIVTNKSAEDMDSFAKRANDAAKNLAASTTDYTEAALIYYQQGLADKEVEARSEATLKAANVTGQSGQEVSEQLTAVWNGYKVSAQETELYVDKLAAVAATTASDLEELSTGMSKVASAANSMGVDIDQLNGHLSTVISVTRQAPESVGTAFKTIYARLGDLAVDGEDEFGTKLGEVSGKLQTMGIDILDSQGQMRDMGTVMEEVAAKWNTWTDAQQQAAAVAMAGKRQYNNLIALFENWDMYEDAVATSANAMGTLQEQQDTYMESAEAHLDIMKASFEDLYDSMLDESAIKIFADSMSFIVNRVVDLIDGIGGGGNALIALGAIGTKVFSKQIAQGIGTTITNFKNMKFNAEQVAAEFKTIQELSQIDFKQGDYTKNIINMKNQMHSLNGVLTQAQEEEANQLIRKTNELYNQQDAYDALQEAAKKYIESAQIQVGEGAESPQNFDDLNEDQIAGLEEQLKQKQKIYQADIAATEKWQQEALDILDLYESGDQSIENFKTVLDMLTDQKIELTNVTESLEKELGEESEEFKHVKAAMEAYEKTLGASDASVEGLRARINELASTGKKAGKSLENSMEGARQAIKEGLKGDTIKANIESAEAEWNNFIGTIKTVQQVQQITNLIGSLGQVSSGIQAIINLWDVWNNEDLTAGEKVLQTVSSLSMALPMLVTGFSGVGKGIIGLAVATAGYEIAVEEAAEETEELTGAQVAAGASAGAMAAGQGAATGATAALTGAIKALTGALMTSPFGPFLIALAATAAVVGVAAAAIDLFSLSTEEASERITESKTELENIESELQSLQSELDSTKSKIEELESKGSLTLIEQKELAKLKQTNSLLEAQIALEEKKKEVQEKKVTQDYANYFDTGNFSAKTSADNPFKQTKVSSKGNSRKTTTVSSSIATDFSAGEKSISAEDYGVTENDLINLEIGDSQEYERILKTYTEMETAAGPDTELGEQIAKEREKFEKTYNDAVSSWMEENGETVEKAIEALPYMQANNENGQYDQQIKEAQEVMANYYKVMGTYDETISNGLRKAIATEEIFNELKDSDALIDEENKTVDENLLKQIVGEDGFEKIKADAEAAGLSIYEFISSIQSETVAWEDLAIAREEARSALGSQESIDLSKSALKNLSTGEEPTEEELEHLKNLEAEYEELGAIQDRTSHEYLDTLRKIKEEQENIAFLQEQQTFEEKNTELEEKLASITDIKEKIKELNESGKFAEAMKLEAELELQTEEAESIIKELEESDHRIKMLIEADLASDVDDAFGLAEEFSNLQEMIPQSLEVTYAEAQAIIESGNGAILQNSTETANQTIMLHGETANAYIDAKQAELEASKEQKIKELEQERALLVAQKEALTGKLEALQTALTTEDAASAAAALQEAQRYDELYKAKVEELNAKLTAEGEKATEEGAINEELYNNLGGMYETDVANQENAEESATNTQKANIEARIRNVQLLHSHYTALARQIAASENGDVVPTAGTSTTAEGGVSGGGYKADEVESQDITEPKEITEQELEKYFDEGQNDKDREEFNATIQAMIDGTTAQINGLDAQIGSIDAGIAALNSATTSLDDFQNNLGPDDDGGGSDEDPEQLDKVTLEDLDLDPYRRVNSELERIANNLEQLSNEQDRLYGDRLLKNLQKQSKELKNQVHWTQKKLDIANDEKDKLYKKNKNGKDTGALAEAGIKVDEHGDIINADSVLKAKRKDVNKDITKYNNMTADEQESEAGKALKKQIENKKAAIEALKENIDDYEELINSTIPDLESDIQEAAYQQIEIEIQKFKVEGQLYLDMSEALEQLKDFKQKMNEYLTYDELDIGYTDDGTDLALGGGSLLSEASISEKNVNANLDMLLGKKNKDGSRTGLGLMGTIGDGSDSPVAALTGELNGLQSEYEKYRQDPENYNGKFVAKDKDGNVMKDKDGNVIFDEAGFREAMQETSANLEEEIAKVEEAYKENREALLNSIDLIGESYAQQMETYDFINDRIESQIEAAKLLNGETDYAGMQGYYEQASANAQAKADTAKEEMDLAYKNMNDESLSAEEREKWKKIYEESVAEYEDASFAAIEAYKAENENYVRMQADAAFGTDAELDLADAQWDVQTKLDDKYLDDIDKAYEVQKLSRKLQQDMDGASLAAQQKLAKFRDEELEKLKEKDKLTQYDVDRANKLYEIELKKIALEEAQQNKSKMRLRRDSSGNYSYQFVADEDQTAEAQQGLEDAQYGLREMDLEHQRELQEEMLEMQKEYKEKWIEYNLLSEEEQKLREDEYKIYFEYYQGELTSMAAQALETQDNLKNSSFETAKTLYSQDKTNFKDLTDAQKLALEDKNKRFNELTTAEKNAITGEGGLMPTWNAAILDMAAKFGGEGEDTFESKIKKAQGSVTIKQEELNGKITAAATGIQTAAQTAQDEATKKWLPAQKKVNTQLKTMNTRLSNANKYLKKQKEWWNKIKEEAQKAIEKTQTYLALTSKEEAGKTKTKTKTKTNGKNNTGENTGGNTDGKGTQGNGKVNKGDKVKLTGKLAESSYESPTLEPLSKYKGAQLYVQAINSGSKSPYHLGTSKDFDDEDTWVGWVNKAQISGYDTGGYTGSGWAPQDKDQGKLAFLHEKELILNSTDTQNILDLVYLLRKMNIEKDLSSATIGGTGVQNAMSANALEYSNRMVGALVTGIDNIVKTISLAKQDNQKLEQNVHITAEFPDVKEAEEIKLALNNLTNRASQYISNSRRR